jgi:hypothetical protein
MPYFEFSVPGSQMARVEAADELAAREKLNANAPSDVEWGEFEADDEATVTLVDTDGDIANDAGFVHVGALLMIPLILLCLAVGSVFVVIRAVVIILWWVFLHLGLAIWWMFDLHHFLTVVGSVALVFLTLRIRRFRWAH